MTGHNFRAYVIGEDGHVVQRHDLFGCQTITEAEVSALRWLDGRPIEIWDGDHKVKTLQPSIPK